MNIGEHFYSLEKTGKMRKHAASKTTSGVNNGVFQTDYEPKTSSQHGLDAESPSCLVMLSFFYNTHVAKSPGLNKCIECHFVLVMFLKCFNSLWLQLCMHLVEGYTLLLAPVVQCVLCSCWYKTVCNPWCTLVVVVCTGNSIIIQWSEVQKSLSSHM